MKRKQITNQLLNALEFNVERYDNSTIAVTVKNQGSKLYVFSVEHVAYKFRSECDYLFLADEALQYVMKCISRDLKSYKLHSNDFMKYSKAFNYACESDRINIVTSLSRYVAYKVKRVEETYTPCNETCSECDCSAADTDGNGWVKSLVKKPGIPNKLTLAQENQIYIEYKEGASVASLLERFKVSRSLIYRTIKRVEARS